MVHGVFFKWYRRLPYLAAVLRSSSKATERRRRHGFVAAAVDQSSRVRRWRLEDG
jgi:hypothetical protein